MDLSPIELRTLLGDGPFPPSTGANAPSTMDALEQYIARARAEGVGILSDYVDAGTASVGAPIFDFRRRVVGAVVVVGAADRLSAAVDSLVDSVRAGADELSAALGWSPPSTVGSL
jgi:DNA-binding IclR family transcriptional regulator